MAVSPIIRGIQWQEYLMLDEVTVNTNSDFAELDSIQFPNLTAYVYITGTAKVRLQGKPAQEYEWMRLMDDITAEQVLVIPTHPQMRVRALDFSGGTVSVVFRLVGRG